MYLCQIDGKIYNDETVHSDIIIKNKNKEIPLKCCILCYGLYNSKYELGKENNIFVIPDNAILKLYKISHFTFDYKPEKDKTQSKELTNILKKMKIKEK
jgi:protein-tyrosine phosphatase